MMHPGESLPWYGWVLVTAILLSQGTWLFLDARRRGVPAWLWGMIGLVQAPVPLLLYWLIVVRRNRRA